MKCILLIIAVIGTVASSAAMEKEFEKLLKIGLLSKDEQSDAKKAQQKIEWFKQGNDLKTLLNSHISSGKQVQMLQDIVFAFLANDETKAEKAKTEYTKNFNILPGNTISIEIIVSEFYPSHNVAKNAIKTILSKKDANDEMQAIIQNRKEFFDTADGVSFTKPLFFTGALISLTAGSGSRIARSSPSLNQFIPPKHTITIYIPHKQVIQ